MCGHQNSLSMVRCMSGQYLSYTANGLSINGKVYERPTTRLSILFGFQPVIQSNEKSTPVLSHSQRIH